MIQDLHYYEKGQGRKKKKARLWRVIQENSIVKACLYLFILLPTALVAQTSYTLSGSGVWTVPNCVTSITVEAVGGGGGGARTTSNGCARGGGGGGAYARKIITVTPGQNISYSVGGGGSGGSGTNHGGDSWFLSTSTLLAQGGRGAPDNSGEGVNGGQISSSVGDVIYSGGNGGNGSGCGSTTSAGGGGGGAGSSGTGKNGNNGPGSNNGGAGGGSTSNYGGSGGNGAGSAGSGGGGSSYGGGGGGGKKAQVCIGCSNQDGGNGAAGIIVITVNPPVPSPTFGNGFWNVTAYSGGNIELTGQYIGYYTEPSLSYDTRNRWGADYSPSHASGWNGCNVPVDNHVVVSRRTGFSCGVYRLDITNHDDDIRVYVNGDIVYNEAGYDGLSHSNIWTGYLNASSTIEVRHLEGTGGSHQGLAVTNVTQTLSGGIIGGIPDESSFCSGIVTSSFINTSSPGGGSISTSNGNPPSPVYQWQRATNNSFTTGLTVVGSNSLTYDPSGVLAPGTYFFRRRVTDGCGNTAYSNTISFSVYSAFSGGTISTPIQYICYNSTPVDITFSTSPSGGGTITYQWYRFQGVTSNPYGAFNGSGWTAVGSPSTSTSTLSGTVIGDLTQTTTFSLRVYDSNISGCFDNWSGHSQTVYVINGFSSGTISSTAQQVCYNSIPNNITYNISPGGGSTLAHQWYRKNGIASAPSGTFDGSGWTAVGLVSLHTPTLSGNTIGNITQNETFALRVYDNGVTTCFDNWSGQAHHIYVTGDANISPVDVLANTSAGSTNCYISDNNWHYFRNSTGQIIAAVNSNGQNLGQVNVSVTIAPSSPVHGNGGYGEGGLCTGISEITAKRWYTITPEFQPSNGAVSVRLYLTDDEYQDYKNDIENLLLSHPAYEACYGTTLNVTDLSISKDEKEDIPFVSVTTGAGPGNSIEFEFNVSSFSTFRFHTTGGIGSPLPVELTSFTGYHNSGKNILKWETASEKNTDRFEIEQSENGKDWSRIGFQKAAGSSVVKQSYSFADNTPISGNNYYRLKIVDEDNSFEYSRIIHIHHQNTSRENIVSIYPNPVINDLTLVIESSSNRFAEIVISNIYGQEIHKLHQELTSGKNTVLIQAGNLPAGTYILSFLDDIGERHIRKFIRK